MVDTASVSIQAFRFLDIRAPHQEPSNLTRYVVARTDLPFPETPFEKLLKGATIGSEDKYIQSLAKASESITKAAKGSMPTGGYLDRRREYEQLLTAKQMSPEAIYTSIKDFYLADKGALSDPAYLLDRLASVWDLYVANVIIKSFGNAVDAYLLGDLASAIRVAAAIFAVRAASVDSDPDIRPLSIASIRVSPDLFDPGIVRRKQEKPSLPDQDDSARDLQNELVSNILRYHLASKELRQVLLNRSTDVSASPALPPGPAPAPGPGGEVFVTSTTGDLQVNISKSRLSATTRELLINEFGATDGGNSIDNVPVVTALGRLDHEVGQAGDSLFSTGSQDEIVTFNRQLRLFERDLRESGSVNTDKITHLPLTISTAVFGTASLKTVPTGANVRPLGIGDLKVVKQNLLRYEASEVAHVENILKGQQKERVHSVKQKTEETLIVEQEKSTSSERDLQTTDRFELTDESSSTVAEKRQNETGVTVTASYGPVSISANTKFSDSSTSEQSSKISRSFAREVVDRSVEKVQQRVREERVRKTTLEIEETNRYSLTATAASVVGIYRWIDKVYWAQVNVYGKRLMLEFMVPEPAALYLYSQTKKPEESGAVSPPEPLNITSKDIQRWNYAALAARYAAEVEAPPPSIQIAKYAGRAHTETAPTNITVPDGYVGISGGPAYTGYAYAGATISIMLGTDYWTSTQTPWYYKHLDEAATGAIPLMVSQSGFASYNVTAVVVCVPSDTLFEQWQLNTFKAIRQAFQLRLGEYQEYLARQNRNDTPLQLRPDREARDIERRELQRACIEMLSQQHFDALGAIKDNPKSGWPEIDFQSVEQQGQYALFFQHGFEWEQITYVFYPYFWARQSEWPKKLAAAGGDMLFSRFLMAGFARVVVPVRPAHESDILYFLETGRIWGDTEPPILGDPRFVSIVDEIKESLDAPDQGVPEGDPWQFKIPTSLVLLDDTGKLPEWPLNLKAPTVFVPSKETCSGVPYNIAQWKDGKSIADAIRKLGYAIDSAGDQDKAIKKSTGLIRAMQMRFNSLGVESLLGKALKEDGIVGPCTLRGLTYFDGLREAGKWPGVS